MREWWFTIFFLKNGLIRAQKLSKERKPSTRQNAAPAVANNPSFSQPAPAAYASASSDATEYAGASSTTATYATYAGEGGGGESSTDGGEGNLLL